MSEVLKKEKSKFCFIVIIILAFIIVMIPMDSYAYSKAGWKLPGKSFAYKWGDNLSSSGTVIRKGYESAVSDWYSASSINLFESSAAKSAFNSYYLSSTSTYGYTDTYVNSSTKLVSYYNAYVNSGNSDISKSNVARSVAVHELGHPIGLDDLTSGTAVMNQQRDRTVTYVPQTDDKNGVSAIY